jgi:hypothetical protein
MKRKTIENILSFLYENEGMELPNRWFKSIKKLELIKELENHSDGIQYKHKGILILRNSKIKKLPNDLYVGGDLYLNNCEELKEFPDKLYVGGDLWLSGSGITELPKYLFVRGDLFIYNTPLADKYTDEQIYGIVASTGGQIKSDIFRF